MIPQSQRLRRVHWKFSGTDFLIVGQHSSVCPVSAQVSLEGEEGTFSSSLSVPMESPLWNDIDGGDCYRHFQRILRLLRSCIKTGAGGWCQSILLKKFKMRLS